MQEDLRTILEDAALIIIEPAVAVRFLNDNDDTLFLIRYRTRLYGGTEKEKNLTAEDVEELLTQQNFVVFPLVYERRHEKARGTVTLDGSMTVLLHQDHISAIALQAHTPNNCHGMTVPEGWSELCVLGGGKPDGQGNADYRHKKNFRALGFMPNIPSATPIFPDDTLWHKEDRRRVCGRLTFFNTTHRDDLDPKAPQRKFPPYQPPPAVTEPNLH